MKKSSVQIPRSTTAAKTSPPIPTHSLHVIYSLPPAPAAFFFMLGAMMAYSS